nr:MAG TPA: hypothetical protein [Caudoviricetes sp.]
MRAGGGWVRLAWLDWAVQRVAARLCDATRLYYLSVVYKLYDLMMDVNLHAKLLFTLVRL